MRFDNFPLELKRKIFSHFSRRELSEKISPVSKEWDILARDTFNWINVEFSNDRDCIKNVKKLLRGTRVEKITFHNYDFYGFNLTDFPVVNSVNEIKFAHCTFSDSDVLRILVQCFPNTRKFSIYNQPKNDYNLDRLESDLKYLQQWRNLKSIEFIELYKVRSNCVVHNLMKLDLHLEELILLKSGITARMLEMIIDHQGKHLQTFSVCFNSYFTANFRYLKLTSCRNLKSLSLFFPNQLMNNEFILILQQLNQLTYLRVESAPELFDIGFGVLFKVVTLHQLEELILGRCRKLNNTYLTLIVKNSPLLKRLTLRSLRQITDKGLETLLNVARNLKILHVECMALVTKRCLTKISGDLPNLCEIVAKNCPQISQGTKYYIFNNSFLKKAKILSAKKIS